MIYAISRLNGLHKMKFLGFEMLQKTFFLVNKLLSPCTYENNELQKD